MNLIGLFGRLPRRRQMHVAAMLGAATALAVMTSGAFAQCVATGAGAIIGGVNLAPFASGGALTSLMTGINTANTALLSQSTAFIAAPNNPDKQQLNGGIWSRAIGGQTDTRLNAVSTYSLGGVPLIGNISCATKTRQDFGGVQIGTDISTLDWGGFNIHTGTTLGYIGSSQKDISGAGPINPAGGTFSSNLEVPFAGVYAAVTRGGFFLDGQFRFNYYQSRVSDPMNNLLSQEVDAHGYSITGNIGYNYALPSNWFIEPSLGIVYSKTYVDPIQVPGTIVTLSGLSPPGTIQISDINSTLGRASLRVGTSVTYGNVALTPFATASVFHDFVGTQTATITTNFGALGPLFGGLPNITGNLVTQNIGTYGQFGVGVSGSLIDSGLIGYIRADYRVGPRIEGYSINAGLRYQFDQHNPFLGRASHATEEEHLAPPVYNWTGPYAGLQVGVVEGLSTSTFDVFGTIAQPRYNGILGGGVLGYNYEINRFVLGVEGDFNGSNAHGGRPCPNGFFFTCETSMNWLSTETFRAGYAYFDRVLLYAKGGLAVGEVRSRGSCNIGALPVFGVAATAGCPESDSTRVSPGFTVGFGSEFALAPNLSIKAETKYYDLGSAHYTYGPLGAANVERRGFVSTVGLNYHFADTPVPTPIIAKY